MMRMNNVGRNNNGVRMVTTIAFVLLLGIIGVESFTGGTGRPIMTTHDAFFQRQGVSSRTTVLVTPNFMGSSKWDNLVDEDEDEEVVRFLGGYY